MGSQPRLKVKILGLRGGFMWSSGWYALLGGGLYDNKEGKTCSGTQDQVSMCRLPLSTSSLFIFASLFLSLSLYLS